jgi:hypothetical protein
MSFHSNLPEGCTTSDLPGWERPYVEPEILEEVQFFPVIQRELPEPTAANLAWRERLRNGR